LRELAEQRRLPEETAGLLQAQFSDLPWDVDSWRQMAEYSPEMKQFACVLHLYDVKAYDYLRKTFPLPHPYSLTKQVCIHSESLSSWLSNKEAAAGFSSDMFLCLQEKVERGEQAYLCCALLLQEVSLCKQQEWDPQTRRLTGFIDLGAGVLDADEAPLASEAIVLMAVGISSLWTAPLGCFFVSSVTGCLLAQLLHQAISKLSNVGVRVLAVTSGTTARGAETARALGIRMDPDRIQCTFQHPPGSAHSIAFCFDVCQALQLVRNALQCFQRIQALGDTVQWQHVVELAALPERRAAEPRGPKSGRLGGEESYHLKVNLAALLFSEGVAAALEHLQELGLAAFQNCSGTVGFVRLMSRLCDVFHGRGPYRRGLEGPLLAGNYTKISQLFNEAKNLFITLTDAAGSCVVKSKRRLGFLSLLLNAESLEWLHTSYVCAEGAPSPHLLTHAFSLDPLELFLRTLQQAWGGAGTPTCAAFQAAYRKLLAGWSLEPCPPRCSPLSSTSSFDTALSCKRELTLGSIRAQCNPGCGRTVRMEQPCYAGLLLQGSALSNALTDLSQCRQSVTRAAGFIVEQLSSGLQCEACLASLFEADERRPRCGSLLYVKRLGGVSLPSASVCRVTSVTERVLNLYGKGGDGIRTTKLQHLALELRVFQELLGDSSLFPSLTEHLFDGELCLDNHYTILVKEITRRYLNIRTNHTRHLSSMYCCGRCKSKQPGGTYLFPAALGSCQPSQSHLGS
ncbi:THAP9 transposase, partial [Zapornia atra]|nr:THAP9 transposase [Zapornia atra]